jgi:glucokinase
MLLVGDIGGTKAHLAFFEKDHLVKEEIFPSSRFRNLSEIIEKFLDRPVEKACLALAGPVHDRKCRMTNVAWEIDAGELEKRHRISSVHLMNDLEAASWGLCRLKPQDLVTLNVGSKQQGNQAVIAAGTGLGVGGLYWDGKRHLPFPSEGGHVEFGPRNGFDKQFWDYLHKKYGHVSVERVVSGPGIEHLYWFLVETGKHKKHLEGEELPRLIIEDGLAGKSPVCQEVLRWFVSFYGAASGNIALQFLCRGGLYLAGGIAPKIIKLLEQEEFMKAFVDKGRFQKLLEQIPVHVVLNESLQLLGALEYSFSKC